MRALLIILQLLSSIGVIVVILLQSGRQAGLSGAVAGGAETLFGKKRGMDEMLGRFTMYAVAVFFISSLLMLFF